MACITKELADKIVKKLKAKIEIGTNRPHDLANIYHEGKLVASFGIRRGSKKEAGHDHIPSDLYIRSSQAKLLGQCPMSREDWIKILITKNLI